MTLPAERSTSPIGGRTLPPPSVAEVILKPVTDSAYQICDGRYPSWEPGHLLGFAETVGDDIEVMQVGSRFIWTKFACMHDAVAHVVATAVATRADQEAGDHAWVG